MADIAQASMLIVPRFDGLQDSIEQALGKYDGTSTGKRWGSSIGGGLLTQSALFGTFSAIASKAIDSISSHVDSAVQRFDTLNQYPKTMELLGYSAEDAEASISLMSDRLSNLPTTLQDMASVVQGIVVTTGDLDQATKAGLALNDMLVASGSSTQLTTAAMEQFRQMLSKGKPEMEDWKSLTSAMPGQMDQLAKAMLGAEATTNDLYAALGGGGEEATITMDELLDAMIRLDTEGGEGITSFQEQAETAAGGVQTAMSNASNAVTKGIASIMDEVGQDRISGAFDDLKTGINEAFSVARDVVGDLLPVFDGLYDSVRSAAPQLVTFAASFGVLQTAGSTTAGVISTLAERAKGLTSDMGLLQSANQLLGTSFSPVGVAIAGVSALVAVGITAWMDYTREQENLTAATTGLTDAVSDTAALEGYQGTVAGLGEAAHDSAMSVEELAEATAKRVERMNENNEAAEAEIAQLNTAQSIINEYVGATDLSTDAQGRLEWALGLVNEQLGTSITQEDVLNGKYTDQDGNVQDLTTSLNELIEARKNEIRLSAVEDNLTEAYGAQADAAKTLAQAERDYNAVYADREGWIERYMDNAAAYGGVTREAAEAAYEEAAANGQLAQDLASAQEQYAAATDAVGVLEDQMGVAAAATSEAADAFDLFVSGTSALFQARLDGGSLSDLAEDLRTLGADTERLGQLSEDELGRIASAYDGTTGSIVGVLDELGVGMDEAAAATARSSAGILDALSGMANDAGVDLSLFASRLAEAGVSTEDLNRIGTANIDALATACNGDIDAMVTALTGWNDLPFVSKDGDVTVEDGQLVDAQGRIWTWNGTEFKAQETSVSVVTTAMDAAQRKWANMVFKTKYAKVEALTSGFAAGGIRLNATGGIVPRYHADGAIATKAVPLDIVGEDGAEAIVPLTNRRYSQPFVDLVADGVAERVGAGDLAGLLVQLHHDLVSIYGAMPDGMTERDFARLARGAVHA